MRIQCPMCGETCESDEVPEIGQHVLCPYCNGKFSYDGESTASRPQSNGVIGAIDSRSSATKHEQERTHQLQTGLFVDVINDVEKQQYVVSDALRIGGRMPIKEMRSIGAKGRIGIIKENVKTRPSIVIKHRNRFCRECGNEISPKAIVCPKCGVPVAGRKIFSESTHEPNIATNSSVRVIQTVVLSLLAGIVLIVVLLWLVGYMTAMSDVKDGQSLIGYMMRRNEMNFITAEGYSYYFKHNTNIDNIRRETEKAIRDLEKSF